MGRIKGIYMTQKLSLYILIFIIGVPLCFSQEAPQKSPETTEGWNGNINLILGTKVLNEDDWAPQFQHKLAAYSIDFGKASWKYGIVFSGFLSTDELVTSGVTSEITTEEIRFGLIRTWRPTHTFRLFFGAGATGIKAKIETTTEGITTLVDDEGNGYFLSSGFYWTIYGSLNLGLLFDVSSGKVTLNGSEQNAGGSNGGIILGYHW